MVYRAAFTGLFWLSADPKCLRPRCFSSSLTSLCQFPLQLFLQVSASSRLPRWIHTICASLFWFDKERVTRKWLLFLYRPLRPRSEESSDRIMRILNPQNKILIGGPKENITLRNWFMDQSERVREVEFTCEVVAVIYLNLLWLWTPDGKRFTPPTWCDVWKALNLTGCPRPRNISKNYNRAM